MLRCLAVGALALVTAGCSTFEPPPLPYTRATQPRHVELPGKQYPEKVRMSASIDRNFNIWDYRLEDRFQWIKFGVLEKDAKQGARIVSWRFQPMDFDQSGVWYTASRTAEEVDTYHKRNKTDTMPLALDKRSEPPTTLPTEVVASVEMDGNEAKYIKLRDYVEFWSFEISEDPKFILNKYYVFITSRRDPTIKYVVELERRFKQGDYTAYLVETAGKR